MEKEQESIEYLKKQINICLENAEICDDNNFDEEATYLREESYMLETVLNMLKEKDKEIEKLEKEAQKYFEDIIKQDRVIDLMAETIRKLAISLANYRGSYNEETINFTGNIKDIKQYFERKATNDG